MSPSAPIGASAPRHVSRIPRGPSAVLLTLVVVAGCSADEQPGGAESAARVATTELNLLPKLAPHRSPSASAHAARHADRGQFGDDWYRVEEAGDFAWARGKRAELALLVAEPERVRSLVVEVMPAAFLPGLVLEASLGETSLGHVALDDGWQRARFDVPAGLAKAGFNALVLSADREGTAVEHGVGPDARRLAFACGRIAFDAGGTEDAGGHLPTRLTEPRVGIAPIRSPRTLAIRAGESTWAPLAVDANAPGRVRFELAADGPARVRVRASGRGNGAVLFDAERALANATNLDIDLGEAAGTRVLLELSVLSGSAPVAVRRASLFTERTFMSAVVIVIDTLRADHVIGSDRVRTPNIDAFAARGIIFPTAFSHANITLPSHTALFSSRLPWETGVIANGMPVGKDLPLFADWLGEIGYETRAVVSMGSMWPVTPLAGLDRGFTTFDYRVEPDMSAYWANERLAPVLDEIGAVKAAGAPFFLFVHYSDPHRPFHAHGSVEKIADVSIGGAVVDSFSTPDTVLWEKTLVLQPGPNELTMTCDDPFLWLDADATGPDGAPARLVVGDVPLARTTTKMSATIENPLAEPAEFTVTIRVQEELTHEEFRTRYASEVAHVDGGFGALIDELDRRDLFDDTLVVFTSDHGQGLWDHNAGGHGKNLFDEQIHVPLVIKPPVGHPSAGALAEQREDLVRLVDLVPSMLEVMELPPLPGQTGLSLLRPGPRVLVAETHYGRAPVIYAMRDKRWKLLWVPERDRWALFDVIQDPDESEDVFEANADAVADWQKVLRGIDAAASGPTGSRGELGEEMDGMLRDLGYVE